jgi:tetratricopeptide (TPR) repeat protein
MQNRGFNNQDKIINQIKVSLCMIVKNEAERLANCLKSGQGFVDEIILVDTGSSDRTINIAKKFGAKIYKFPWGDDFASARNYALQQAQGEWVLVLDGDEVLEQATIPILKNAINNPDYLAINLSRAEVGSGRSPISLITRLFRRHPDIYFTGFYHESIDRTVALLLKSNPSHKVITIPQIAIHHFGYQAQKVNQKREFAQKLMEKQLTADPDDAYTHSKLGALYVEIGAVDQGLALLQKGLSLVKEIPTQFELNYHLGIAYSHQHDWERAKTHYQTALDLDVADVIKIPVFNNLGNLYQTQENFERAIACYEKLLEIAPDFATAYFNLGIARKSVYDFTGAIAAYIEALKINPQYAEAYQNLGVALEQTGKVAASKIAFIEAIKYHKLQNCPQSLAIAQQIQTHLDQI